MPSAKGKPQPDYDEIFKARAVARLYAEGYPKLSGALRKVSHDLGIPHQTLSRWVKGIGTSVDIDLVEQTVTGMEAAIEHQLEKILGLMDSKGENANFRDLAIAYGVLFDKRQLLRGAPTSRTERLTGGAMATKSDEELRKIVQDAERAEKARRDALAGVGLGEGDGGSGAGETNPSVPPPA